MAVLVILMAGAALAAPQTFAGIAPHVALLLGIVMFGMGTTLRAADFRRNLQRMAQHFGIPGGELSFRQGTELESHFYLTAVEFVPRLFFVFTARIFPIKNNNFCKPSQKR